MFSYPVLVICKGVKFQEITKLLYAMCSFTLHSFDIFIHSCPQIRVREATILDPYLRATFAFSHHTLPPPLSKSVIESNYSLSNSHQAYPPKCPEPTSRACAGHFLDPSSRVRTMIPVCSPLGSRCGQGKLFTQMGVELKRTRRVFTLVSETTGSTE